MSRQIRLISTSIGWMLILAAAAFSQLSVSAVAVSLFPVGRYESKVGVGYGGLAGFEVGDAEGLSFTGRSGYLRHLERDHSLVSLIPILGGFKSSTRDGAIYMAGELGAALTHTRDSGPLASGNSFKTNPAWAIGLGSAAGSLDLRFSFQVWDARHTAQSMSLGLSFGFLLRGA